MLYQAPVTCFCGANDEWTWRKLFDKALSGLTLVEMIATNIGPLEIACEHTQTAINVFVLETCISLL